MSESEFKELVLSFPNTEANPHFDRIGFKVSGKRMFASYLDKDNTTNIFLTPAEQSAFCEIDCENIIPLPNKWGEKGATNFKINFVSKEIIFEALYSAYQEVIKPKIKK